MKDKVREELKGYANTVSENCLELKDETDRLACFVEDLQAYRDLYDTSIEGMDERYK